MPTGVRPRVNEAREFLEIAKDFKDPKEIIREALSNSWDAKAKTVTLRFELASVKGTRKKKIRVSIEDDGEGMSNERVPDKGVSELEAFFNLGDSIKPYGSIGTKGHGTKIFYRSEGIILDTWKNGKHIHAETEVPPWNTLKQGQVPTYRFDEDNSSGRGTRIVIEGFEAKQSEFDSIDRLEEYIRWYTVAGSFGHYFGDDRRMEVRIQPLSKPVPTSVYFGFRFPDEDTDLAHGSEGYCKLFGPQTIACGETESGNPVEVHVIGAILDETKRGFVPHTYEMMGLWLCKDFLRIERNNTLVEEAFKGQYFYRQFFVLANCQGFDLTANRNNIRTDQEEYDIAVDGIVTWLKLLRDDPATEEYFRIKKVEEAEAAREKESRTVEVFRQETSDLLMQRLNEYKGRPDLNAPGVFKAPIKEPKNEAETALLLQAMITAKHPGIDFRIGEYNAYQGTDLVVEYTDKEIPRQAWAEIVHSLSNLFEWPHPPYAIHKVICWERGRTVERTALQDGTIVKLNVGEKGRHTLVIGPDVIDVYVLREILYSHQP